jgi:hypothetical protein
MGHGTSSGFALQVAWLRSWVHDSCSSEAEVACSGKGPGMQPWPVPLAAFDWRAAALKGRSGFKFFLPLGWVYPECNCCCCFF